MTETLKLLMEKDGPIGWIVFNQPEKRNAVSQEMWELMPKYVNDLATDDNIRVVVLRGAGEQAFVSGADISQFKDKRRNMADEEQYRQISARGQDSLTHLQKPLLAMIHGFCIGGGVGIAITGTMLARQRQSFSAMMGERLTIYDPATQTMLSQLKAGFIAAGADAATATNRAYYALSGMLQRQAAMVSFVTIFRGLGFLFLLLIPLVMLMRRPRTGAVVDAAH